MKIPVPGSSLSGNYQTDEIFGTVSFLFMNNIKDTNVKSN
jgi:hypothetical protein